MQPASPRPDAQTAPLGSDDGIKKLVVAVHGIGSQRRGETIRSVARWFGQSGKSKLPLVALGFFHMDEGEEVRVSRLEPQGKGFDDVGFAEIYWADIPRAAVAAGDTLEDTKAWGKSVAGRAEAAYRRKQEADLGGGNGTGPADGSAESPAIDFEASALVVEEIVESIAVLENLLRVLDKMGVFRFEVGSLLRDYLGDVQTVTEFKALRSRIVARFDDALTHLFEKYGPNDAIPDLYIVAHSEGSVVAFLALLGALSRLGARAGKVEPGGRAPRHWVQHVRGFMTIGSPIDKHLVLWPQLFEGFALRCTTDQAGAVTDTGTPTLPLPIKWRNYYDYGDPIGFKLDTAIEFLKEHQCAAFDFTGDDNYGFSRYWFPGKAHNDYWDDDEVFGHFIGDVVKPDAKVRKPTGNRFKGFFSTSIPYVMSLLLHVIALFMLFKGVTFLLPEGESKQVLGATTREIWLLGFLFFGCTFAARVPRLVKRGRWRWPFLAWATFLLPAWLCLMWLPRELPAAIGLNYMASVIEPLAHERAGVAALLFVASTVALSGWLVTSRQRWGRAILLGIGVAIIGAMVLFRIVSAAEEVDTPVWPLLLSGVAFLYFWWLGIMLFDLAFVWHRYIRESVALDMLRPKKVPATGPAAVIKRDGAGRV